MGAGRKLELLPYVGMSAEYIDQAPSSQVAFGKPVPIGLGLLRSCRPRSQVPASRSNLTLDASVNPDFGTGRSGSGGDQPHRRSRRASTSAARSSSREPRSSSSRGADRGAAPVGGASGDVFTEDRVGVRRAGSRRARCSRTRPRPRRSWERPRSRGRCGATGRWVSWRRSRAGSTRHMWTI